MNASFALSHLRSLQAQKKGRSLRRIRHCRALRAAAFLPVLAFVTPHGTAQDTRIVVEPTFPPTCNIYPAPLQSTANGPAVGPTQEEQATESRGEAHSLTEAFAGNNCSPGQAVELSLGSDPSYNAFLLDPFSIPAGMSLIIDAGVTVYATRDPSHFQTEKHAICGSVRKNNPINGGCRPFITLLENSGIYGYGILDGQGNQPVFSTPHSGIAPGTWWDHITTDKKGGPGAQEESPVMNYAGNVAKETSSNANFVFYKITIRNPQYHIVDLGGLNQTVWGVKIQAPWNVPNTDGFDIHASNVTVRNTTVSNGDQEIAFSASADTATENISVENFHGYNKGGITILGNDGAFSNILVKDAYITGDLPQVSTDSVNGLPVSQMGNGITSYTQALPNSTNDLKALQISTNINTESATSSSALISNITFESVRIRDIVKPIVIAPVIAYTNKDEHLPVLQNVTFKDIHVLPPTLQLPLTPKGFGEGDQGIYQVELEAYPQPSGNLQYMNQLIFDNVVFDDVFPLPTPTTLHTSLGSVDAEGNNITYKRNAYPFSLTQLAAPYTASPTQQIFDGTLLTLNANNPDLLGVSVDPALAHSCPTGDPSFLNGDLFLSTKISNNAQVVSAPFGTSVTLNAVVQPIMSQSSWFVPHSYGNKVGLLAVGSPALTNQVTFFEGSARVGTASFGANGTLASVTLANLQPGTHIFTAQYPADAIYPPLTFGSVKVTVVPPSPTSTAVTALSWTITAGSSITVSAIVTPSSATPPTPTGTVTFLDRSAALGTVSIKPTGNAFLTTSWLVAGNHAVTATYNGDENFAASTSPAVNVVIIPPLTPDFTVELLPGSVTLTKFAPAVAVLTVTSLNGFNAPVSFTCSGAPSGTSCAFSPASLTPVRGSSATTTLSLSAASAQASRAVHSSIIVSAFSVGGLLFISIRRRSALRVHLVTLLLATALSGLSGCGGNTAGSSSATTSKVTITAVAGAVSHIATFDLTYVTTH